MVTYSLPRRIRYIPASGIFTAAFNVPTAGKYDFAGQSITFIEKLSPGSVYLIDSFSVGGNISGEDYLSAIDVVPRIKLCKAQDDENVFDGDIPLSGFFSDRQLVHFFETGLNNCTIKAILTGSLIQTVDLIGVPSVSLSVSFSLHRIDEKDYAKNFQEKG